MVSTRGQLDAPLLDIGQVEKEYWERKTVLLPSLKKFNKTYGESLLKEQKSLLQNYIASFNDNGIQLKIFLNEELGRLRKVVKESIELEEINSDSDMLEKTNKVLAIIEEFKNKPFNKEMLTQILKIQTLIREIKN